MQVTRPPALPPRAQQFNLNVARATKQEVPQIPENDSAQVSEGAANLSQEPDTLEGSPIEAPKTTQQTKEAEQNRIQWEKTRRFLAMDEPERQAYLAQKIDKRLKKEALAYAKKLQTEGDPEFAKKLFQKLAENKINPKVAEDASLALALIYSSEFKACYAPFNLHLEEKAIWHFEIVIQGNGRRAAEARFQYLQFKADLGDENAQFNLGKLYLNGKSAPYPSQNLDLATYWLRKAADAGEGRAAYYIHTQPALFLPTLSNSVKPVPGSQLDKKLAEAKLAKHYFDIAFKGGFEAAILEKKAQGGYIAAAEAAEKLATLYLKHGPLPGNEGKPDHFLARAKEIRASLEEKKVEFKRREAVLNRQIEERRAALAKKEEEEKRKVDVNVDTKIAAPVRARQPKVFKDTENEDL